jgi:ribonuclease HI
MHFDGVVSKEGASVGVDIMAPYYIKKKLFSYKFYFECANNVAKYEALILGLNILKELQEKIVHIYSDSKLVI